MSRLKQIAPELITILIIIILMLIVTMAQAQEKTLTTCEEFYECCRECNQAYQHLREENIALKGQIISALSDNESKSALKGQK